MEKIRLDSIIGDPPSWIMITSSWIIGMEKNDPNISDYWAVIESNNLNESR